ncbi:MAG TPA: DUF4397 domain-containing protein [Bryobacteraceae bacterium]|nr:DUF4397 domain-containing protein [Bryobacteraceae bacterium]
MKTTRKTLAVASITGLLILAGACSSNTNKQAAEQSSVASKGDGKGTAPPAAEAKQADKALVRFVNGTSSSKDLAFGDAIPFSGVGSDDISAYKELPAERHDFKLTAEGNATVPLATNSEGLSGGKHYTILAYTKKDGKAALDPITDDLVPPNPDQAKVRVINLAPALENADLYVQGKSSPLISGVGFEHATDYKDVAPTNAELVVRHGTSKRNSASLKDVDIKGGKLYTILVFQDKHHKLSTKIVEDQFTSLPAGS